MPSDHERGLHEEREQAIDDAVEALMQSLRLIVRLDLEQARRFRNASRQILATLVDRVAGRERDLMSALAVCQQLVRKLREQLRAPR